MKGQVLIDTPKDGWSHLVASDLELLHSFAEKIGLKREWFQDKHEKPHYDIKSPRVRKKAIDMGAQEVHSKTIVRFLNRHYTLKGVVEFENAKNELHWIKKCKTHNECPACDGYGEHWKNDDWEECEPCESSGEWNGTVKSWAEIYISKEYLEELL